jgi:hypothetical protein
VSGDAAARRFIAAAPLLAVTTAARQGRDRIDVLASTGKS